MKKAGNRASSSKKPQISDPSEDTSYIVFGNGKSKKKAKNPEQKSSATINGVNGAEVSIEDTQKKPDARKLIGGASWTGKLPVNMLSEHCQKQKWGKPEYTMVCSRLL